MNTLSFGSSSLSFLNCADDIRFVFDNNILNIVTRKTDQEKLQFNIIDVSEETIEGVVHIVLISNQGDTFYIVDNQFHREDDKPAVTMRRFALDEEQFLDNTARVWAKIWMKKGLYHRSGDKPALIFKHGDLLWMENGHFKRNPFTNASIYTPNGGSDSIILCSFERSDSGSRIEALNEEDLKRHIDEKLLDFSYDNA